MSSNGFSDMAIHLGTIAEVTEKVTLSSLEKAAEFYLEKLLPNIPKSLLKKKHAADHVEVIMQKEEVIVRFEDTAFYWRFPENGTTSQKAQHFASGTFERNKDQIEKIMTEKLLTEMKG